MLRRHAALVAALAMVSLVGTGCLIRTNKPRRGGPVYRPAPGHHHKPKKHKKEKKRDRDHRFSDDAPSFD